jgi:dolichyl-diphosphooligosaccharide--protein glycosyltransferase
MREKLNQIADKSSVANFFINKAHLLYVFAVVILMFVIRMREVGRFISENKIYFSGNDPWYHFRQTMYTVQNWPNTMEYDPWTGYPIGFDPGHFGTLYDQILATLSLIAGLGSPTETTVRLVMITAPAVFGALTAITVYYICSRMWDKYVGIIGVTFIALIPGVFLSRTLVGVADHNAAEPLFMAIAFIGTMYALKQADENKFILEDFKERGEPFKKLLKASTISAVCMMLYILIWPPGILMVGITGVFYFLYSMIINAKGESHEDVLIIGGVSLLILSILLIPVSKFAMTAVTTIGLMHILISLGLGVGCLFLIGMYRVMEKKDYEKYYIPSSIGLSIVSILFVAIVLPDLYNSIRINVISTFGLTVGDTLSTIGEAQSLISRGNAVTLLVSQYGFLIFFSLAFYIALPIFNYSKHGEFIRGDPRYSYLVVWSFLVLLAGLTQIRFNYYLAVTVAITGAISVRMILESVNIDLDSNMDGWQYISIAVILLVIIVPLAPVIGINDAYTAAGNNGPGGYTEWEGSLEWMEENTPEIDSLDYYGDYKATQDFDYNEDAYSVMSWWDYGHWITTTGERIPFANPFQQHAEEAAQFLLAQSDEEAMDVVENMSDENNVKYVAVDWQMVSPRSKFGAPTVWHPDESRSDFIEPIFAPIDRQGTLAPVTYDKKQRYYESLMVRLYLYHGSAMNTGNVVTDYRENNLQDGTSAKITQGQGLYRKFNTTAEAENYIQNDTSSHIGGVGIYPREKVDALENYRYVMGTNESVVRYPDFVTTVRRANQLGEGIRANDFAISQSFTKIFERVPGATINGNGAPPNSTVLATVQLEEPNNGDRFNYRQYAQTDENGEFEMTVPYSTTGYNETTLEDGFSNPQVRAVTDYRITTTSPSMQTQDGNVSYVLHQANFEVSEEKVIGKDESPVEVSLEEISQSPQQDN